MLSSRLEKIARSFGAKAMHYDRHAVLQKDIAATLARYLPDVARPTVLEIGCGTGFVTDHLLRAYPEGDFTITDLAPEMIARCAEKYARPGLVFSVLDGQALGNEACYDVIVIGMAAQWFDDPCATLEKLRGNLNPGGRIVYSVPGAQSFLAWKETVTQAGLSDGLLNYPEWPGVVHREMMSIDYGRVENFLKSLKEIGAGQPREGAAVLHPAALRRACRAYNRAHGGVVEWEIVYGSLQAAF